MPSCTSDAHAGCANGGMKGASCCHNRMPCFWLTHALIQLYPKSCKVFGILSVQNVTGPPATARPHLLREWAGGGDTAQRRACALGARQTWPSSAHFQVTWHTGARPMLQRCQSGCRDLWQRPADGDRLSFGFNDRPCLAGSGLRVFQDRRVSVTVAAQPSLLIKKATQVSQEIASPFADACAGHCGATREGRCPRGGEANPVQLP